MAFEIRPIEPDEFKPWSESMGIAFGFDYQPEAARRWAEVLPPDRTMAALAEGEIVGTFGSLPLDLSLPGGSVSASGVTGVTVLPTHRRQGILSSFMDLHLARLRESGEPIAALWASETTIYGRYGFGPAVQGWTSTVLAKADARLLDPTPVGSVRMVAPDHANAVLPAIHDTVWDRHPGMFRRWGAWWEHKVLFDPPDGRDGATAHRCVVLSVGDRPAGYAVFRTKDESDGRALLVLELFAENPDAERGLWRFLFDVDLVTEIRVVNRRRDDPLHWWLVDPRRLSARLEDTLWVRLVDVAAALTARRYEGPGSLVVDVVDPVCPWNEGRWRLSVLDDGTGIVGRSRDQADLALGAATLATIYLGSVAPSRLWEAGMIDAARDTIAVADRMFTWPDSAWGSEMF